MFFTGGAFWTYLLFVGLPVMALSWLASNWVKKTYARYSRVPNSSGLAGAEVAERLLQANGLTGVRIALIDGELMDNYDPRTRTLNLSRVVAAGKSVAAEAVVAHEIGHAVQDATAYAPMRLRAGLVPAANLGSQAGPLIVMGGLVLSWFTRGSGFGLAVAEAGLLLFAAVVLFQMVTTPVELNASHRALSLLTSSGTIHPDEADGARRMLRAAAFTYWVALLASILTLLYYASLVLSGRRTN